MHTLHMELQLLPIDDGNRAIQETEAVVRQSDIFSIIREADVNTLVPIFLMEASDRYTLQDIKRLIVTLDRNLVDCTEIFITERLVSPYSFWAASWSAMSPDFLVYYTATLNQTIDIYSDPREQINEIRRLIDNSQDPMFLLFDCVIHSLERESILLIDPEVL